jgi:hypothetical protein
MCHVPAGGCGRPQCESGLGLGYRLVHHRQNLRRHKASSQLKGPQGVLLTQYAAPRLLATQSNGCVRAGWLPFRRMRKNLFNI